MFCWASYMNVPNLMSHMEPSECWQWICDLLETTEIFIMSKDCDVHELSLMKSIIVFHFFVVYACVCRCVCRSRKSIDIVSCQIALYFFFSEIVSLTEHRACQFAWENRPASFLRSYWLPLPALGSQGNATIPGFSSLHAWSGNP